jgi:hypothetical protein
MNDIAETNRVFKARAPRHRVLNGGKLIMNDGHSIVDCVIRDMSEGGAKVRMSIPTVLPAALEMLIVKSNMIYPVSVRWNRNSEVGLQFTGPGKATARRY